MHVPITANKKAEMINRQKQVAALYLNRVGDMQEIADKLNVSKATVSRDVKALKARWAEEAKHDISQHIARELAELDRMELEAASQYQAAKKAGKDNIALRYADHRLGIKDRRAKLLGLDKPSKFELNADMKHEIHNPAEMTDEELQKAIENELAKLIDKRNIPGEPSN